MCPQRKVHVIYGIVPLVYVKSGDAEQGDTDMNDNTTRLTLNAIGPPGGPTATWALQDMHDNFKHNNNNRRDSSPDWARSV